MRNLAKRTDFICGGKEERRDEQEERRGTRLKKQAKKRKNRPWFSKGGIFSRRD